MKHQRPFEVSEALYPFEDHWFERGATAMHYVDHGSGLPVVMLHGNPTWSFLYRDIVRELDGHGVRALAPDYPGFGFSGHPPGYGYTPEEHAEWVEAWLASLELPPFVLVVQDWGGPIGLSYAVKHPERVAGLVIMNTWAWPTNPSGYLFSWAMGGPLGKYLQLRRNFFADKIVKSSIYYRKRKSADVFRAYTDPFPTAKERIGTYVFPRAIRKSGRWLASIERELHTLADVPVELVFGMKDVAFGHEPIIARWRSHFPRAAIHRLEKAAHYLQEDQPEVIAQAILRVVDAARTHQASAHPQ